MKKVGAGRFPGKADVGRQAPQGRDAEAGQRKSRLSAHLDLALVKEAPTCCLWAGGAMEG